MPATILAIKIYRRLHIAVFIPSHENCLLVEWKSSKSPLRVDLYRSLAGIDRLTYIGSF